MIETRPSLEIAPHERRRRARQRTRQSGVILFGEAQIECLIVDQSETGARLAVTGEFPDRFHLLRVKSGECHEATLVWRDDKHAGVAFSTSYSLAEPTDHPRQKRLRLIWQRLNRR